MTSALDCFASPLLSHYQSHHDPPKSMSMDPMDSLSRLRELEISFCKDFICCGRSLLDLHDLLQHYEEYHVHDERDSLLYARHGSSPQLYEEGHLYDNVHRTMHREVPPVATHISNLDLTALENLPLYLETIDDTEENISPPEISLSSSRSTSNSSSPSLSSMEDVKAAPEVGIGLHLVQAAGMAEKGKTISFTRFMDDIIYPMQFLLTRSILDMETSSGRPYKCKVPGCDKTYKNANGLKYHKNHGHCLEKLQNNLSRPYVCHFSSHCYKRYKNLNGLKYHIQHAHLNRFQNHAVK
ncbi:uncharacterized protein BYT42DRAFT_589144 [Radiomyces spectabilis]|uniref:uncharacterized protein n=1 Tax=Radiomyces spectabilis TaxID=64574 RepID=UPI002220D422|nr:uncharacterized protein BYT42DRAFT_589144 [Radiomyces spectabilis]KAI8365201.1 hypothetical protein BYT42DRAFT_589144 [Radiomyces spectabilis]